MTNEEAIERINGHIAIHRYNEPQAIRIAEAFEMAIEALEAQKWIPCYPSELPKDKVMWVTHDIGGYRYVDKVFWDMTEWSDNVSDVVAYMPYVEPEPYIGEET